MSTLDSLLQDASSFVVSDFGFDIEQSKLKIYSFDDWRRFCEVNPFVHVFDFGVYVPVSYSAYVRTNSPFLISDIFHEFFGHGLFVEHSQIGKRLTEIIQNNGDEKSFMFKKINPQEQVFGIADYNIHNYEGFAVWLEALLCEEIGNKSVFEKKKQFIHNDYLVLLDYFNQAEESLTRFGLIAQMGFPKYYDYNKVLNVFRKIYGSKIRNVDFVLLRGSQKPESDIDLFVVSGNESRNFFNGWLDIYEVNRNQFEDWAKKLDISITDPLFSGKLIYGDKNYFEKIKQQIQNQPITREAINHNISEVERLRRYRTDVTHEEESRKEYIESFSQNAEQLSLGNKPLTLKKLQEIYAK